MVWFVCPACRKAFHHTTNSEKNIALVLELFPLFGFHHHRHSCSKPTFLNSSATIDWNWVIVWCDSHICIAALCVGKGNSVMAWLILIQLVVPCCGYKARVSWCLGLALSWSLSPSAQLYTSVFTQDSAIKRIRVKVLFLNEKCVETLAASVSVLQSDMLLGGAAGWHRPRLASMSHHIDWNWNHNSSKKAQEN